MVKILIRTKVMDSLDNEYGCYGIMMGVVREQQMRLSNESHWKIKNVPIPHTLNLLYSIAITD